MDNIEEPEVPETPEENPDEEVDDDSSIVEDSTEDAEVEKADLEVDFKENYATALVREDSDIIYYINVTNNTDESMGITEVKFSDGSVKTYEEYLQELKEEENTEIENPEEEIPEEDTSENTEDKPVPVEFVRGKTINNITIRQQIPEGVTFDKGFIYEFNEDIQYNEEVAVGNFDENTRIYTLNIGELAVGETYELTVRVRTNYIDEIEKPISSQVKVTADGVDEITTYKIVNSIARPNIETTFTSSATDKYVKENDEITYYLTAKNTGKFPAQNVTIMDLLPEELKGLRGTFYLESDPDNVEEVNFITANKMSMVVNIDEGDTLHVEVKTKANDISQKEVSVDNVMTLDSINFEKTISTDSITTIVQQRPETSSSSNQDGGNRVVMVEENRQNSNNSATKQSQRITGRAWADMNRNGKRDQNENGLSNVSVTLYSAETNEAISKTQTDGTGAYIFDNLENGKYYIVFGYDTTKYALTDYQKEDVDSSMNSDAILTNALAITDIISIENNSIGDIDIGLIEASVFDLNLNKSVTKITVQTKKGTKAYEFDDSNFAKVDIHSKELEGAGVYMEYKITVSNKGELAGYARTIVDYIPEGTIFSANLNPGWYEGPDGLIYTNALENEIINPGEGKSIKLVLFKQMTEENTGIVSNSAEIAETFNENGAEDIDSIPGNGADNEDDLGTADIVISVETGGSLVSGAVFVVFVIVALVGVYIFKKNVLERMRRW